VQPTHGPIPLKELPSSIVGVSVGEVGGFGSWPPTSEQALGVLEVAIGIRFLFAGLL
jgi:hypothetical protein